MNNVRKSSGKRTIYLSIIYVGIYLPMCVCVCVCVCMCVCVCVCV